MSRWDLSFDADEKPKQPEKKKEDIEITPDEHRSIFSYLQIPKRKVNEEYPFYFYMYNPKTDGVIFLITALLIPLIVLFVFHFALGMGTDNPVWHIGTPMHDSHGLPVGGSNDLSTLIYLVITIISNIIGCVIFWQRDKELFFKSGFFVFYAFTFITNLVSFVVGIILGFVVSPVGPEGQGYDKNQQITQMVSIWSMVIAELIVIWWAFNSTTHLMDRIKTTLKENWLQLLIVAILGAGILYAVTGPLYTVIFQGVKSAAPSSGWWDSNMIDPITGLKGAVSHEPISIMTSASANQQALTNALKDGSTGYKVAYAISLFVLTILVAPLTEELATRNAWFEGTGNKTIAWITTAIFFGMLHVQAGDVEHILTYVLAGAILGGVFCIARGNVTYDASTHIIYNLISYIILLVTMFK